MKIKNSVSLDDGSSHVI